MASETKTPTETTNVAKSPTWFYIKPQTGLFRMTAAGITYDLYVMKSEELSYDKFLSAQAINVLATRTYISGESNAINQRMMYTTNIPHNPPVAVSFIKLCDKSDKVIIKINDNGGVSSIMLYDIDDFSAFQQMCIDLNK